MIKLSEILELSSDELVKLVASYGISTKSSKNNKISAYVTEHGTFTSTKKSYVKIVIVIDDANMYDYGVRLWCDL